MAEKDNYADLAFEIVALAGDARATFLRILGEAKENRGSDVKTRTTLKEGFERHIKEACELITECHQKQTEILQKEAQGEGGQPGLIMIHAQDHLMTCMLLKELVEHILELYGY